MDKSIFKSIISECATIEQQNNVKILLAIESGSRAWDFASPDSDYDVRFLYVRPMEYYLRLEKRRDVIEWKLDDVLDINGWDFDKTLRLLHASNPTLFEWLNSPIVYCKHPFIDKLIEVANEYFLAKSGLYHYLHMAEGNYREYLKGEQVKLKKYFYVLRPILACKHILEHGTPPPMLFETLLYAQLDKRILPCVEDLLTQKKETPELGEGPRVDTINFYIEQSLVELKEKANALPPIHKANWQPLNDLFLEAVNLHEYPMTISS